MVIQPAVEVNPVVNTPPTQANRWWSDSRQQGLADAQIGRRRGTVQTTNRESIKTFLLLILAHCLDRAVNAEPSKP